MLRYFSNLLKHNIKTTFLFVSCISFLSAIPLFSTIGLINICAFLCGLIIFFGYVIQMGYQIRGESDASTFKVLFKGEAKYKSDFLLLMLLFSSILIFMKGPFYLVSFIAKERVEHFLTSSVVNYYTFVFLSILFVTLYKTALYAGFASLGYHRNEVIEAFKTGLKGIFQFKLLILIIFAIEVSFGFLPLLKNEMLVNAISRLQYIWPPFMVVFMLCAYKYSDSFNKDKNIKKQYEKLPQPNATQGPANSGGL